ncbi:MAG: GNAT family N-acetyltransferase, partial [Acidimicrobiales bacterium]|nr:GNAT family N-acetyltransferase [Acidimicrobiales bacterium]
LRFLGSPLRGWTTAAMGSTLEEGVDPALVLAALPRFAFAELGCIHLECADRSLLDATRVPSGFHVTTLPGYELELAIDGEPRSDADLLAAMTPHGRRDVRRSLRNGIVVEAVDPLDPGDFASVYYQQVSEAFARRSRLPTYPVERVEALIRHLGPTGDLLLLRSRTPAGEVAATGIFPGIPGGTAEFWMGASTRSLQPQLPNEALMWEALRRWRDRGASRFNFGGGGTYKAKYGGAPHTMPWARRSRFAGLEPARAIAFDLYRRRQRAVR